VKKQSSLINFVIGLHSTYKCLYHVLVYDLSYKRTLSDHSQISFLALQVSYKTLE